MKIKSFVIGIGVFVLGLAICIMLIGALRDTNGYLSTMFSILYLSGVIAAFMHYYITIKK